MGKKKLREWGEHSTAQPQNFVNKDSFQKMNFLYQASHLLMGAGSQNAGLARFYNETLLAVRKKLVLKVNADVKKSLCKRCHGLLIPGQTAKFRHKGNRRQYMVVTCLSCKNVKRWRTDHVRGGDYQCDEFGHTSTVQSVDMECREVGSEAK